MHVILHQDHPMVNSAHQACTAKVVARLLGCVRHPADPIVLLGGYQNMACCAQLEATALEVLHNRCIVMPLMDITALKAAAQTVMCHAKQVVIVLWVALMRQFYVFALVVTSVPLA